MLYYLYLTQNGEPKTGLSPNFETLISASAGTDKSANAPTVSELSGGLYKYEIIFGTAPWNTVTEDLIGVIDADPTTAIGLTGSERYIYVEHTLRGLALAKIAHKGIQTKSSGDLVIYGTDKSTEDIKVDMTDSGGLLTRDPIGA
jgi:hypothetical protein